MPDSMGSSGHQRLEGHGRIAGCCLGNAPAASRRLAHGFRTRTDLALAPRNDRSATRPIQYRLNRYAFTRGFAPVARKLAERHLPQTMRENDYV